MPYSSTVRLPACSYSFLICYHTYLHYFPALRIAVFRFGTTVFRIQKPVHILYIQLIRLTTCIFCKPVPRMYARRIVIDPFHYSFNSRSLRPPGGPEPLLRDPVRKSAETPRVSLRILVLATSSFLVHSLYKHGQVRVRDTIFCADLHFRRCLLLDWSGRTTHTTTQHVY